MSCQPAGTSLSRRATVEVAVIPDADHGFDQREKSPLSTLHFDTAQRDAPRGIVQRFLDTYAP